MVSDGPEPHNARDGRLPLLLIFFLSGASGLIYEVVWSRSLVLVFGSTTHAVSTVLAAFMGGLALGSILVGRRGDRMRSPLKVYAILEVAIAVLALAVLVALPAMVPVYRLAWSAAGADGASLNLLRFLLASLVLLPPTTLMGATLPILSAQLERGRAPGAGAGALYASNTFGAVAGAALSGFLLLPALGMTQSALVAAAANLIAAAAALRLARALPVAAAPEVAATAQAGPWHETAVVQDRTGRGVLLIVFAASGAGALMFEVVWTRILSLVLGSSTQAFSIMLTTFLTGLALGSAAATRWLMKTTRPLQLFTLIELGAGMTAFGGIYLFPELPYAFLRLFAAVGDSPPLFQAGRFLIAGLVMLPPTLLLGAAFPLAARAALRRGADVAAPVAALYTANTVGAILGSTAAGFILIPALGLQASLLAGCAINIAAGAILLAANAAVRPALRYSLAGVFLLLLPGLIMGAPPWNGMVMTSGVFQYAPHYIHQFHSRAEFVDYHSRHGQLYYKDGPTTTVSVEKRAERVEGRVNTVLSVNGKVDASTVGDIDTQVLLGQLPMLVSPDPASVLVIGLGSGASAGSALTHPLQRLAIVEIEPAILEAEVHFQEMNGRPLADPRTSVRINDARNDLLVSDETYDVIISEPSNPWLTGPSKLFTREFFQLARSRLKPGGMLCQWVQLYGMDPGSLRALLRTYATVFPHRMIFKGSPGDLLVLGSDEPIRLDVDGIAARMTRPAVQADLDRVRVHEPADLFARFRLADGDIDAYLDAEPDGPLNTDDNALVEFAAARSLYREDQQANEADLTAVAASIVGHLVVPASGPGTREGRAATLSAAIASRLIRFGLLPRAALVIDGALEEASLPAPQKAMLLALRGDLLHKKGDAEDARACWIAALEIDPLQPEATLGLASRLIASGQLSQAASLLEKAPADPACRLALGKTRFLAGDPRGALSVLDGFERLGNDLGAENATLRHLYRGRSLEALGEHEAAARELRLYFELYPQAPRPAETSIEAATDLARAYTALNRQEAALEQYRVITGLADSLAAWNRRQAAQAIERKDLASAAASYSTALKWNHRDNQSRRLLARTLNDLNRHLESIVVWRELDKQLEGDAEALRNVAALSLEARRTHDAAAAFRRLRDIEDDPEIIRRLDEEIARLELMPGPLPPSVPSSGSGAPLE